MSQTKITQLESAVDITANDLIHIVDIEDGTMAPSGTNKKITAQLLANDLAKIVSDGAIITANSSTDAVRITQTGTGNALVVEDSENPDLSPFAINNNGQLIIGGEGLVPGSTLRTVTIKTNSGYDEVNNGSIGSERYSNSNSGVSFSQGKARGTWQSPEAVQSGDYLGSFVWRGHDGNQLEFAAYIGSSVDGTPEVGSMPGSLSFHTTPDGSILANERMRITSAGNVGIGTDNPVNFNTNARTLHIKGTTDVAALRLETNSVQGDLFSSGDSVVLRTALNHPILIATDSVERMRITGAGNVGVGAYNPLSKLHVNGDLTITSATVSPSAVAGTNGDVPTQVVGYLAVNINGSPVKIPYYA